METLERPHTAVTSTEPELHLLLKRDRSEDWPRWRAAAAGSIGAHVVLIFWLITIQAGRITTPISEQVFTPLITKLYTPSDLTQKAPNKGPISKELSVEAIAPRPLVKSPAPAPAAKPASPQPKFTPPPAQAARNTANPAVAEPPKIQAPDSLDQSQMAKLNPLPPLPPQNEKPKLALEDAGQAPKTAGKPTGGIAMPGAGVQEAIRDLARTGAAGAQSVGDIGADEGGLGPGLNLPPSAGRPHSSLQLKSDPMGVDFRPYMLQVLTAVRRNWFAVYPEAARLGARGEVSLMFAISKQGGVTKVVFMTESGLKPLNEAAVAAISASNPLPPLPSEFKGDRIVLQMKFQYNMPR